MLMNINRILIVNRSRPKKYRGLLVDVVTDPYSPGWDSHIRLKIKREMHPSFLYISILSFAIVSPRRAIPVFISPSGKPTPGRGFLSILIGRSTRLRVEWLSEVSAHPRTGGLQGPMGISCRPQSRVPQGNEAFTGKFTAQCHTSIITHHMVGNCFFIFFAS